MKNGLPFRLNDLPKDFAELTQNEIEGVTVEQKPARAWVNRKYMVQLWEEDNPHFPGLFRLSIQRVKRNSRGWADGLTWDDLQSIKLQVGYADAYAIEIFPPDDKIVNVANIRHLWVIPEGLPIGWGLDEGGDA